MVVLSLYKKTQIGYTQYVDNDVYADDVDDDEAGAGAYFLHCEGMDSQTNIKQGGQNAFPPHSEVRRTAKSRAKLPCLALEPKVRTSSHNMHIQHTLGAHVPGFSAVPNMRAHARAHKIHARIYGTCTYITLLARARAHKHAASQVVYNA